MTTNKPDLKDLIDKQCEFEGKVWDIVGVTDNATGTWLQLDDGKKTITAKKQDAEILGSR